MERAATVTGTTLLLLLSRPSRPRKRRGPWTRSSAEEQAPLGSEPRARLPWRKDSLGWPFPGSRLLPRSWRRTPRRRRRRKSAAEMTTSAASAAAAAAAAPLRAPRPRCCACSRGRRRSSSRRPSQRPRPRSLPWSEEETAAAMTKTPRKRRRRRRRGKRQQRPPRRSSPAAAPWPARTRQRRRACARWALRASTGPGGRREEGMEMVVSGTTTVPATATPRFSRRLQRPRPRPPRGSAPPLGTLG